MTTVARPTRGTRPRNRRAIIVTAATELIRNYGYEHVSMGDIADEVAVRGPALYRHFAGKQQLLFEVVRGGLLPVKATVEHLDFADRPTALRALAQLALDHTHLGALWVREVHHLPSEQQDEISADIQAIAGAIATRCGLVRPDLNAAARDLLAWAVLGVLLSPSFHHLDVSHDRYLALLADMTARVLDARVPAGFAPEAAKQTGGGLRPSTRREALLLEATKLFARQRYSSVSIEAVAASLGMAGPSIYSHFSSKSELLATALGRAAGFLYLQVAEVLTTADHPRAALQGLVRSYTGFAVAHPDLVAILPTEVRNLAEPYRKEAIRAQRDYINEWTHLLQQAADPASHPVTAGLTVQCALTVINTITQVHHLRAAAGAVPAITAVVTHLLQPARQPWESPAG